MTDLSDLKNYCKSKEEWTAIRKEMEVLTLEEASLILATNT